MLLAHKIALDPNAAQRKYFAQSCGVARVAYNWGLIEWLCDCEPAEIRN